MDSNEKRGMELAWSVSRFRYVFENRRIGVPSLGEILSSSHYRQVLRHTQYLQGSKLIMYLCRVAKVMKQWSHSYMHLHGFWYLLTIET
jgi:hypothetical protein